MNQPQPLSPAERENLVAYLDGELDAKSARALEAKLNQDAAAKQEAEALQETWNLLDFLPRPEAARDFSEQTVERLEVERRTMTLRVQRKRWLGKALLASGAVAAGVLGFATFYQTPPTAEEMRLLQYRHYYENVDNLEFLQELANPDLFGEDA